LKKNQKHIIILLIIHILRWWTNDIMNKGASIDKLLKDLQRHGILSTKDVRKDLQRLIGSDLENFV